MENFLYNDEFHLDLDSLITELDLDEPGAVEALADDWEITVECTDLEPIIHFDVETLLDLVQDDRMSEDGDEIEKLLKVLKENENLKNALEEVNEKVPKLHYPNGQKSKITKQELLSYISYINQ